MNVFCPAQDFKRESREWKNLTVFVQHNIPRAIFEHAAPASVNQTHVLARRARSPTYFEHPWTHLRLSTISVMISNGRVRGPTRTSPNLPAKDRNSRNE